MNERQITKLTAQFRKLKDGAERHFWFLKEAGDGEPWLRLSKREEGGDAKLTAAKTGAQSKLDFVGKVSADLQGNWVFVGEGTATTKQMRDTMRITVAKMKEFATYADKIKKCKVVPVTVQSTGDSLVAMQRSRLLWAQTRDAVRKDLRELAERVGQDPGADGWEREVAGLLEGAVLSVFDDKLVTALDRGLKAEGADRIKWNKRAAITVRKYRARLANDELVDHVDTNDWINIQVRARLDGALKQLAKDLVVVEA